MAPEAGRPGKIAIDHDDYYAEYCGVTGEGKQFFLTTPFEPVIGDKTGCEYIALFIFDADGNSIEAETIIESFGPRATCDGAKITSRIKELLSSLGEVAFTRIEIKPFSISKFGTEFGFIARVPEEEEDVWAVELMPGNYMAFFEPWNSGEYDT